MKRLYFKELLNANNGMITDAAKIKSMALKQISKGKYVLLNDEIVTVIIYNNEQLEVIFTKNISVKEFREQLYIADVKEQSLEFMYDKTGMSESSLFQMIEEYKEKYYVSGAMIEDVICFKLYSKMPIINDARKHYQVAWINYEEQLAKSSEIYDENGVNGLFTMTDDMLVNCLNEECVERYGDNLLILKPISNCSYLNDEKEIIGDRFKVLEKIDFHNIEEIGLLIKYIQRIYSNRAKKESDKLHDEIYSLKRERTDLIDNCVYLDNAYRKNKKKNFLWILVGVFLGIIICFIF